MKAAVVSDGCEKKIRLQVLFWSYWPLWWEGLGFCVQVEMCCTQRFPVKGMILKWNEGAEVGLTVVVGRGTGKSMLRFDLASKAFVPLLGGSL